MGAPSTYAGHDSVAGLRTHKPISLAADATSHHPSAVTRDTVRAASVSNDHTLVKPRP